MRTIFSALLICGLLVLAIWFEGCASAPTVAPTIPAAAVEPPSLLLSVEETQAACKALIVAAAESDRACGADVDVDYYREFADEYCADADLPQFSRNKYELCLGSIRRSHCEDAFPEVCENPSDWEFE